MINDTNSATLMFRLDFCEMGDHLRSFEAILSLTTAEQLSQRSGVICAIALDGYYKAQLERTVFCAPPALAMSCLFGHAVLWALLCRPHIPGLLVRPSYGGPSWSQKRTQVAMKPNGVQQRLGSSMTNYLCQQELKPIPFPSSKPLPIHPLSNSSAGESKLVNFYMLSALCLRLGREQRRYSLWDCLWILAAVAVYFADVGTDIWLAVDYYLRGQRWWFGLTLFFVVLGSLSVQVFSFRWFVHDFSTEDSATAMASSCQQPGPDCKTVVSGGSAVGEGEARPSTPQRQASNASKSNIAATNSGSISNEATRTSSKHRSASCSFCIWLLQSLIHILQLGQVWRYCIRMGVDGNYCLSYMPTALISYEIVQDDFGSKPSLSLGFFLF
ncbi:XK-related protein 4 [Microtus ochrogaster]|uniref:XK-related protein n=1 Tax=Microtus ochrogaster TaxID=79684 RepID=A0A8J6GVA5_MICOH|nr:XK-related protein 4 [Microtus ochrogaster]